MSHTDARDYDCVRSYSFQLLGKVCIRIGILDKEHAEIHSEHNFEIQSDDETTSISQSFFQQANSQQPQDNMIANFDEIEYPTDNIQGNETFQEYLETTEAQLSAGPAIPIEDVHPVKS